MVDTVILPPLVFPGTGITLDVHHMMIVICFFVQDTDYLGGSFSLNLFSQTGDQMLDLFGFFIYFLSLYLLVTAAPQRSVL